MRFKRVMLQELRSMLTSMDGLGYGAYKRLTGIEYSVDGFIVRVTHVQGDPHAPPSFLEVVIPPSRHGFPDHLLTPEAVTPFTDFLARRLHSTLKGLSSRCGLGNSCFLGIPRPSHKILRRSSVDVMGRKLILRFFVGLPAHGRRVLGREALKILTVKVVKAVNEVLRTMEDLDLIEEHVSTYLMQQEIRDWLLRNGYSFFIGRGAILPRKASFSEDPLPTAIPFQPPESLTVKVCVKGKCISGLAARSGVTVITGGAYHGKTTLLEAIQEGIYDHIKGDGRELVVSVPDTMLVRAEDGRIVNHVDISTFMHTLPDGTDTRDYSTLDASGSSSMASSISEALEAGVTHILLDEDISATNLLYKDDIMSSLIPDDPIKPLNRLIRGLRKELNLSTTAIVSASSSLLKEADTVILMRKYVPEDITNTIPRNASLDTLPGTMDRHHTRLYSGIADVRKVKAVGFKIVLEYGSGMKYEVDLRKNPRFVEEGQVRLAAHIIRAYVRPGKTYKIAELIEEIRARLRSYGFNSYADPIPPDLTLVDPLDIIWVINRLFNVRIRQILNP